ncbi:MAG: folate-binding protein [Planctomycetales bacterium]|nr:folate-binding protein [Planctomycetales bacterium]NIM08081.1 folate-binding protein [Planctomycetales bacterium]NIN07572.1 folate-binding protein [Planctomycetales bacterium]NIN76683.1 folate-binding protein [Planctomycetales bacterium]NIO33871.1 folate-binding protein [Planctomycetales bacterium]
MSVSKIDPSGDFDIEYEALTQGCGLADWSDRTLIEVCGADRVNFLHNFTTNDIKALPPGRGCELFVTDVKGKTRGHGIVLCRPDSLVLETTAGQAQQLIGHLDHYLLREQVTLVDRSHQWTQRLLVGPQAAATLEACFSIDPPQQPLDHATFALEGQELLLYRTDFFGPDGFCLLGLMEIVCQAAERLAGRAVPCGSTAVDTVRLEAGTPWYGVDIHDDNLPQEVARDQRAISFTKGCYLGQETVARIDALGHVNRILCGVRFTAPAPDVPATGTRLLSQEKTVGLVSSATYSPQLAAPLALAYLSRGHERPGTRLDSGSGPAEVVGLPLQRP